jgi:hypothetical protein
MTVLCAALTLGELIDDFAELGAAVLRPYTRYAIRRIKFLRGRGRSGGMRSFGK